MRSPWKRLVIIGGVLVTLLALVGGLYATVMAAPSEPEVAGQTNQAGLDPKYDDSWVQNVPSTIDGFEVLFVATPKNMACSFIPNVTVRAAQRSFEEFLEQADGGSVVGHLRAIPGVPQYVEVAFAGPNTSKEATAAFTAEWNAAAATLGCGPRLQDQ